MWGTEGVGLVHRKWICMTRRDTSSMRVLWRAGMARRTGETSRSPYWITTVCVFICFLSSVTSGRDVACSRACLLTVTVK